MDVVWNQLSVTQQTQFLREAGIDQLPDPSGLTQSQFAILGGIVGEEKARKLTKEGAGGMFGPFSLEPPKETGDWSDIVARVAELQTKLSELQTKTSSEDVKAQKDRVAEANKRDAEKLKEQIDKLAKASKSGLLGKIFGWIGAIVGLIGAVIATAATGGTAAPALAIAVVGVTMMALQESGAMEKIVDFLVDKPGVLIAIFGPVLGGVLCGLINNGVLDEDKAKMAIQVAFGVAMLVASLAGMAATGGASATDAVFKIIGMVGQIAGGLASVGGGASTIAQAAYGKEAADAQADMMENKAWLARLQQMLAEEIERLQTILDQLNSGAKDASGIIGDIGKSNQSVISHLGA